MSASRLIPLLRPQYCTALTMACQCWRPWGLKGATTCSLAIADWPASLFFSSRTLGWLSSIGGLAATLSDAAFRRSHRPPKPPNRCALWVLLLTLGRPIGRGARLRAEER